MGKYSVNSHFFNRTGRNNFPLVLERIVLGPNLPERNINKEQLRLMIKYVQIRVTDDFEISFSTIDSYRK